VGQREGIGGELNETIQKERKKEGKIKEGRYQAWKAGR
jgi:hypothetical protein